MSRFDYDLFTVGAGSGGVRASRMSAQYGARVAVSESYRVGGTCVVRGCIPKKLFVYASHFSETFREARGFGWTLGDATFDWKTLRANKDTEINRLNNVYISGLKNAGVEIVDSRTTIKDQHTVHIESEGRDVTAERILVATGAWPFLPEDVPGIEYAITSNEAFHLEELPRRALIVGGGYIAVEFAGIYHGLGVETTLAYRGDEILRGFDVDLRKSLHEALDKKGLDVLTNARVSSIEPIGSGVTGPFKVSMDDGRQVECDLVMYATGRVPHTKELGLENAGVELDDVGAVKVDAFSKSSQSNIFAVGDVTNRLNLTPIAIREGAAFAETVYNDNPQSIDHKDVATAVFSQPELGTVGLTEAEAIESNGRVDIYKSVFRPMKNSLSGSDETMMMKLIVDAQSEAVLGCHILGPDAGEMAQCLGIAIKLKATKPDFDATVAVHPTAAEELVTMREKYTVG
jgi:glutathione reductase (NADPH)